MAETFPQSTSSMSVERWQALVEHSSSVGVLLDREARVIYISPAAGAQLGAADKELTSTSLFELLHPEELDAARLSWQRLVAEAGSAMKTVVRLQRRDASSVWMECSATNLLQDPSVSAVVCELLDVSDRRRLEDQMRNLSLSDAVTGLANRVLLTDRLGRALSRAARRRQPLAVLWLDLDGFRAVNEAVGHVAADELLRHVADRLRRVVAEDEDTVARLGADEFVFVSEAADSPATALGLAQELLERLAEPFSVGGAALALTAGVGVALSDPTAGSPLGTARGLLDAAHASLREAKTKSAGHVVLHDPSLPRPAERTALVDELAVAVEQDQLRLHFQPLVDLQSGRWEGVECLLRWQHPTKGLLGPGQFLRVAEDSGLTPLIGDWVVEQACRQLARWARDPSTQGRHVAVNLSVRQLCRTGAAERILQALHDAGAPPAGLLVEVTESTVVDDPLVALAALEELKQAGVRLALDDFGTGYSSLTYLKQFPFDLLKIDRSFVAGLGRDDDDSAIVASVISLAATIGVRAVAEGVETIEQRDALVALGCHLGQGYLWSRPLPAEELEQRWAAPPVLDPVVDAPATKDDEMLSAVTQILQMHHEGASLHTIAAALNAEGRQSPQGRRWHPRSVARVVAASDESTAG